MKQTEIVSQRIKLQHFKVVMAVAQSGSMGKASKILSLSQPVVSKVIGELEDLLGAKLFDRSPHGVALTLYGRALLRRCVAILDDVKTSVDEIRFLSDPTVGELRLGCTEPLLAGIVTATIERLWREHPRIALRTVQAERPTLLNRDLPERRIELAVIPVDDSFALDGLDHTVLYHDFWHVVAGLNNPWTRRRKVSLADLVDEPWCAAPLDTPIGALLIEPFRARGLKPPRMAVSSVLSPQLMVRLLEGGRLIAVMADSLLNYFYAGRFPIKRLPVEIPMRPFAIAIVAAKNRTISPVAQRFIDCAREVAGELEKRRAASNADSRKTRAARHS